MSILSRKFPLIIAIIILATSFGLMFHAASEDSAIMDELAHIGAGYSYLKFGDNRLNPEHPPLTKDLSAIPLLFSKLNFPLNSAHWQNDVNGQWDTGKEFLYQSGNNADKIILLSRLGSIILTLITGWVFFLFCRKRLGNWWALLPLFLFSFSPLVLAHGHYVTTDIAAAFGTIIALWSFTGYLKNPSRKNLIIAGLCFGLAQLCKFSLLLLIPIDGLLAIIFYAVRLSQNWPDIPFGHRKKEICQRLLKTIGATILIFGIGYLLVYLIYLPQNINYPAEKQGSDTRNILESFAGEPDPTWKTCTSWTGSLSRQTRCLANIDIWMSQKPIFKPIAQYALGALMVSQRSSGGNTGYFLGEVSATGWKNYFPTVFLIKEPLSSLCLMLIALIFSCFKLSKSLIAKQRWQRLLSWLWQHFSEFSILIFVITYWIISIRSPLNIGFRHLLPIIPPTYFLTAYEIKRWWRGEPKTFFLNWWKSIKYHLKNFGNVFLKSIVIAFLLIWYLVGTISIAPQFITYFNELVGGSQNGYRYVVDSNLDWGQDLKRLVNYMDKNEVHKISLDYFGGGDPKYYLGSKFQEWQSSKGEPEPGSWFGVSLTFFQNATGQPVPGFSRKPEDAYQWLTNKEPITKIGHSILIYKF